MKILTPILSALLLCACAPERPRQSGPVENPTTSAPASIGAVNTELPPGAEIVMTKGQKFYTVQFGHFTLGPYAVYDTRQGAINAAWNCYNMPTSTHEK